MENQVEKYSKEQIGFFIVINIILLSLIIYASTSLTLSFFGSIGEGNVKTSNLILGIVNDSCKIFFPICFGLALSKKKFLYAAILIIITLGTMFISYLASQGLDLNTANKQLLGSSNKNEIVGFKAENLQEKNRLLEERNEITNSLKSKMDSMPSNYITRKNQVQSQINNVMKEYSEKTSNVQSKITGYNDKIENYKIDTSMTTAGYHALAKSTGMNVDKIAKIKNIFLEVLSIILALNLGLLLGQTKIGIPKLSRKLRKKEKPATPLHATATQEIKQEPTQVEPEKTAAKKIGFNTSKQDNIIDKVDNKEARKYVDKMYETAKNNKPLGYKKISNLAGVEENKVGKNVFEYLKFMNVIDTEHGPTKILKDRGEVGI